MSAKKSFDVQPKRVALKKKRKPSKKAVSPVRKSRTPTLRERREARRQMITGLYALLALIVLGGALYLLWQPHVRIHDVKVENSTYEEAITRMALAKMEGTVALVFPKDSFLFFPEQDIRQSILDAYPSVVKVSISRMSFTALRVSLSVRHAGFLWCGTPEEEGSEVCYVADEKGFVFAPYAKTGTTTELLIVYAPLETASSTIEYPLRAQVIGTEKIPDILRFSRVLESLGTPLASIAIRGDEADVYTEGGTRITYVIGREREAESAARTTFPKLNLMDGSIEYVDLRFGNKVYIKRVGE